MNRLLQVRRGTLALAFLLPGFLVAFDVIAEPALAGTMSFKFFSDALVYEAAWSELGSLDGGWASTVGVFYNYLGPFLILSLTGGSRLGVFLLNVMLFVAGFRVLTRTEGVRSVPLLVLLLLNPLLLPSLFSVNKEMPLFCGVAVLLAYWRHGGVGRLIAAVLLATLVRWQYVAFVIMIALVRIARPMKTRARQVLLLGSLLVGVSLVYRLLAPIFGGLVTRQETLASDGGLFLRMTSLQEQGLYFLVFVPKAIQLLALEAVAGEPLSLAGDTFFNNAIRHFAAWYNIVLGLFLIVRRRVRWSDPYLFLSATYAIVFVVTPVFEIRYMLPVMVIMTLAAVSRPGRAQPMTGQVVRG